MLRSVFLILFASLLLIACQEDAVELSENQGDARLTATDKSGSITERIREPIKLYKAATKIQRYGGRTSYIRRFEILLANRGYPKKVSVWHKQQDGNWSAIPAYFNRKLDPFYELWTAQVSSSEEFYDEDFVLKYEVDGQTFWDNNANQDYRIGSSDGTMLGRDLDLSHNSGFVSTGTAQNTFLVSAYLRNIAYAKEVEVVYSTDNWQTVSKFPLEYVSSYGDGSSDPIASPNRHGVERWQGQVALSAGSGRIDYALVYRVSGREIWDNNFGSNYQLSF